MSTATIEQPTNFITAQQARIVPVTTRSSHDVFRMIALRAAEGETELYLPYNALAPETMDLLGEGGYRVRRGGVDKEYAIISWGDEDKELSTSSTETAAQSGGQGD